MSAHANEEKWNWTPEVTVTSELRLHELLERIKPVVTFKDRGRCYIKPVDSLSEAYTSDPEPTKKAVGLKPLCDITTYHPYSYYGVFRASVAQVILQIPSEHLDKVTAFEIVKYPETAEDLDPTSEIFNSG
jgi:hypothetical protein